tara:strand:- start:3486 stop:4418 length:933 start_codon:yes stop_codon:yes gene_type:complete
MKKISIIIPCYNEEENVFEVHKQVKEVVNCYDDILHEIIFIDNASTDKTVKKIKEIITKDKKTKLIVNAKNFGQSNSPFHAMLCSSGDAVVSMVADLQTPAKLIHEFIKHWKEGYKIVLGIRNKSQSSKLRKIINWFYYKTMEIITEHGHIQNFIGFALYDRQIVNIFKQFSGNEPYVRGMINEIGFEKKLVNYNEPLRQKGYTKNNFFTLLSIFLGGLVNYSKTPLRLMIFVGLISSLVSIFVSFFYLILKIIYWNEFSAGLAPLIIGVYLIGSLILLSLGIVGEYVANILDNVKKKPLVVEKERINFD